MVCITEPIYTSILQSKRDYQNIFPSAANGKLKNPSPRIFIFPHARRSESKPALAPSWTPSSGAKICVFVVGLSWYVVVAVVAGLVEYED